MQLNKIPVVVSALIVLTCRTGIVSAVPSPDGPMFDIVVDVVRFFSP